MLASSIERSAATTADAKAGARAVNAFATDLYRGMIRKGKNLVLSPASVMLALSMARAGAKGETADQMDEVMRDAATNRHANWMNGLERAMRRRSASYADEEGAKRRVTLRIANAAFLQQGYPFEPAFLDALAERFGAGVRPTDFRAQPSESRQTINDWVKERTSGRIPRLLDEGDVTTRTRFALVNAIYLKAAWARTFSPDETANAPFRLANGNRVIVPTMVGPREMGWIHYAWGSGWRAAQLPYVGNKLAMTVILPDNLASFETDMSGNLLSAIVSKVAEAPLSRPVPGYPHDAGVAWKIALPKFSFETRSDLVKALSAAGMPLAFNPLAADFTGIVDPARSGEPGLFIKHVIHQANIEIDEKGTTAAASTAVMGEAGGGPTTRYFKVNRPFIFLIQDVPTGAILFLGRVTDPRAH